MTRQSGLGATLLAVLACHGLATILCGLIFIAAMNLPPFTGIAILFYRGIVALLCCAVVVVALLALAARRCSTRTRRSSHARCTGRCGGRGSFG